MKWTWRKASREESRTVTELAREEVREGPKRALSIPVPGGGELPTFMVDADSSPLEEVMLSGAAVERRRDRLWPCVERGKLAIRGILVPILVRGPLCCFWEALVAPVRDFTAESGKRGGRVPAVVPERDVVVVLSVRVVAVLVSVTMCVRILSDNVA